MSRLRILRLELLPSRDFSVESERCVQTGQLRLHKNRKDRDVPTGNMNTLRRNGVSMRKRRAVSQKTADELLCATGEQSTDTNTATFCENAKYHSQEIAILSRILVHGLMNVIRKGSNLIKIHHLQPRSNIMKTFPIRAYLYINMHSILIVLQNLTELPRCRFQINV